MLTLLGLGAALFLGILFFKKSRNTSIGQLGHPIPRGPRYRDGAATYSQYRGVRYNMQIEDPRGPHSARYQR
ncbi:MAG: hypothetical protein M3Z08_24320, partial [Chloroflexota bacterium]|nr:hypothetical protein [Chloroflexota bacterium]